MEAKIKPLPAREMHKIVLTMVGVFSLCAITFPTAMMRVSGKEKFRGSHIKSLTAEIKKPSGESQNIQPVANKSTEQTITSSTVQTTSLLTPASPGHQQTQQVNLTSQTVEITDPVELEALKKKLYDQLDKSWNIKPTFEHNLIYRVSVSSDGAIGQSPRYAIVSYEPLNQQAKDFLPETPLNSLTNSTNTPATPVGKFTVVFSPQGVLEVVH
jgi:hypothetical protein